MYDLHRTVKCVQILQTVVEGFFLRFSDLFRRLFAALAALVFFWASSIVPASLSDELRILLHGIVSAITMALKVFSMAVSPFSFCCGEEQVSFA